MKKIVSLSLMGLFAMSVAASVPAPAQADDNKFTAGMKKVGNGIMWGPRKLWAGTKAMGKKMSGK